jgi:hypothetical protein
VPDALYIQLHDTFDQSIRSVTRTGWGVHSLTTRTGIETDINLNLDFDIWKEKEDDI